MTFSHELYVKMSHFQVIFVTKFQCDSSHRKNVKRAVIKIFIVMNRMMFCDTIYILLCDESHIMPRQITFVNVNFYIFECSFITFSCLTKTHFKMCLLSPFFMCCSHLLNCVMSHCVVIHLLYTMLLVTFNIPTTIVSYYYYSPSFSLSSCWANAL